MKIEVGMYAYSKERKYLGIGKISYIDDTRKNFEIVIRTNKGLWLANKEDVIASYNVIDLIEEDDYINNIRVTEIKEKGNDCIEIMADSDYELITTIRLDEIETILTKEQFEREAYKI